MSLDETMMVLSNASAVSTLETAFARVVEPMTHAAPGNAEDSAVSLASYVDLVAPCATTVQRGATVEVSWAARCTEGPHLDGREIVTILRADPDAFAIHCELGGIAYQGILLSGHVDAHWKTRAAVTVDSQVHWSTDGGYGTTHALRTISFDETFPLRRVAVDGTSENTMEGGTYRLVADGIEVAAGDPIADRGTFHVTAPSGNVADLTFERLDPRNIAVTFDGLDYPRTIVVTRKVP